MEAKKPIKLYVKTAFKALQHCFLTVFFLRIVSAGVRDEMLRIGKVAVFFAVREGKFATVLQKFFNIFGLGKN